MPWYHNGNACLLAQSTFSADYYQKSTAPEGDNPSGYIAESSRAGDVLHWCSLVALGNWSSDYCSLCRCNGGYLPWICSHCDSSVYGWQRHGRLFQGQFVTF